MIEREAYAVIWALKRFEDMLFQSSITLFCDHNPLRYVGNCASKSAKLTRSSLALQEYDLTFNYRKGKLNVVAHRLLRVGYESQIYFILIAINMYFCSRCLSFDKQSFVVLFDLIINYLSNIDLMIDAKLHLLVRTCIIIYMLIISTLTQVSVFVFV